MKLDTLPTLDVGPIKKVAMFTDIHWGARGNSDQHNEDNLEYTKWFIKNVKKEGASHILFLGDWFESRNHINIKTLNYSQEAARLLNSVGIPIIFIVGNHDLYLKSDRGIFSTNIFQDLENFILVDNPVYLDDGKWLITPFLFKEEYPELVSEINSARYVAGHFEFRNFVVTGSDKLSEHGADATSFSKPKFIFSGHYHKRQASKNVIYIGNTFPTNYGDAGDSERGMCVFDVGTDDVSFIDWPKAPMYFKVRLSQMLAENMDFPKNARVRCILDCDVLYTEVQNLKEEMMRIFSLREFGVEIDADLKKEVLSEGLDMETDVDLTSLEVSVRQLISEGVSATSNIKPEILIKLYEELQ